MAEGLLISIIIPSKNEGRKENYSRLLKEIESQQIDAKIEVCNVLGVSPAGYARNLGAKKASGSILVFMDDDISLGHNLVLAGLIQPLREYAKIGAVSASVRIPEDAGKFQVRYAYEVAHCQSPIVEYLLDVWVATSACCAVFKDVFMKAGGFNSLIPRGQDPEFSYRLRNSGFRTVIAPQVWVYHPQPDNMKELLSMNFRNGKGAAFVDVFYPACNIDLDPQNIVYSAARKSIFYRVFRFCASLLSAIFKRKFLLILSKLAYGLGYFIWSFRYRGQGKKKLSVKADEEAVSFNFKIDRVK